MFCVQCGKESGDDLIGGLCHDCFARKTPVATLPLNVDLEICAHCHARRRGEVWINANQLRAMDLASIVVEGVRDALAVEPRLRHPHVSLDVKAEDERNFTVTATVEGPIEGVAMKGTAQTRARVKNATCLRCSRLHGGYYESVVQIRAQNREMTKDELRQVRALASRTIERIVGEGDANAFVLKDLELEGGIDIYCGTTNAGRMIGRLVSTDMGGKTREHAKVAGRIDGIDVYRITFAIRLPEYKRGDLVIVKDEPWLVAAITAKNILLRSPQNGHQKSVERVDLEDSLVLKRDEALEAVVVSRAGDELQLLDPWNFQTVTVLKPAGLEMVGDSVHVLKWNGELVPLP